MLPNFLFFVSATLRPEFRQVPKEEVTVTVTHIRPSRILNMLGDLIPDARSSIVADDKRGTIKALVDKADADMMRSAVPLFDVRPALINAEILVESPADHLTTKTSAQLVNNGAWTFNDATFGIEMSVTGRINEDGTVTAFIKSSYKDSTVSVVSRIKAGQPLFLRPGVSMFTTKPMSIARLDKSFAEDLKKWDDACIPAVTIKLTPSGVTAAPEFRSTP